jgi:hypothetical protein
MTTTMKQQSTSQFQVAEKEQQWGSTVEDDGGCQERTAVEEQQLCGSARAYAGCGDGGVTNAKSVLANKQ